MVFYISLKVLSGIAARPNHPIKVFDKSFFTTPADVPYVYQFSMLILNNLLYFAFALWLDARWQGEFGAKKGFFGRPVRPASPAATHHQPLLEGRQAETVELGDAASGRLGPQNLPLELLELTKKFGDKTVNDQLTFDVGHGEIFALLGHNGAGKTTLINQLVGMLPPTTGDARIAGYSILDDMEAVRRNVSVCPQDNPIWNEFTVRQHLEFFAVARGQDMTTGETGETSSEVIQRYARALGIEEKLDTPCVNLSGGQKRRMWVATALLGKTRLCILD